MVRNVGDRISELSDKPTIRTLTIGVGSIMTITYTKFLLAFPKCCEEYIIENNEYPYGSSNYWVRFWNIRNELIHMIDFLKRVDGKFQKLNTIIIKSFPGVPPSKDTMKEVLTELSQSFEETNSQNLKQMKIFSMEESQRIDEAFHCLVEHCYWSSVINSAVAIESRLFLILRRRNKQLLTSINKDLRFTFGALADAYLRNKPEFNNCIPKRHEHLLKHINEYRIVSAHPKQFNVDQKTTDGIFNFALAFLLDEECKPPKKRGRKKTT